MLSDPGAEETQRFVRLYGEAWHQQVLTRFRLAASGNDKTVGQHRAALIRGIPVNVLRVKRFPTL